MTTTTNPGNYVDFDEYVGLKLEKTRSTIRTTDFLTASAGVAAMFLAYLLVFVVLDQWVVRDGFGVGWRWTLLSTLMLSTMAWLVWKIGIPSFRTVNGLFAAKEIEKSEPGLKSNLLNLIDLKASGRSVNPAIMKALERRAAVRLQEVDVTHAIDHRPLVRTAYVLLAVIVLFCLYALFSPKKISNSIWRGLLPAAEVPLATRTEILSVKPGDMTIPAHTPSFEVQVDLGGEIPHQVWMLYTTSDGRFNRQPVELRAEAEGQTRFKGQLIGETAQGLMQDVSYVIKAGDAESQPYKITVEQPPSAEIETVRIEFPAYMKLEPVIQSQNGQIDAWDGAKVIVTAKTNMPVRSGTLQFLDDPQVGPTGEDLPMSVSSGGRQLQATWNLELRKDGTFPKYYRIDCKTEDGRRDTAPTNHSLTIRPDLPPDVVLLQPERDLEAPANATIPLLIQASDPDFELGYLYLNVEKDGQRVSHEILSEGRQPKILLKHDLVLSKLKVVAGDSVDVWIEAYDNKQPRPNTRNTPKIKIRALDPVTKKEAEQQLADQQERREEKMAEAEREMNSDAAEKPSQSDDESKVGKSENEPRPEKSEPSTEQKTEGDKSDDGQNGKTERPQSGQNNPDPTAKQQGEPGSTQSKETSKKDRETRSDDANRKDRSEAESKPNQPLSSDGSQDDEALKRLSEKLNKDARKPNPKPADPDPSRTAEAKDPSQPKSDSDSSEKPPKSPGNQDKKQSGTEPPVKEKSASENSEKQSEDKTTSNEDKTDGDQPKPDAPHSKENPGKKPENDADSTSKTEEMKSDTPPAEGADTAKTDENPDAKTKKNPDKASEKTSKSNPGQKPVNQKQDKSDETEGDQKDQGKPKKSDAAKDDMNSEKNPGQQPGDSSDEKNSSDPDKTPAKTKSGQNSSDDLPTGFNEDAPKQKDFNQSDKSKQKSNDSDSAPDGPRENSSDSPNAKKKAADGTEKGPAKPDRDPNSKPHQAKNDDVKRDPNEKSETRPGDKQQKPSKDKQPNQDRQQKTEPRNQETPSNDPPQKSADKQEDMKDDGTGKRRPDGKSDQQKQDPGSDSSDTDSQKPSDQSKSTSESTKSKQDSIPQKSDPADSDANSDSTPGKKSADQPGSKSDSNQNSSKDQGTNPDQKSGKSSGDKKKQEDAQSKSKASGGDKKDGDKSGGDKKSGEKSSDSKQSGSQPGSEKGSEGKSEKSGQESSAGKPSGSSSGSAKPGPSVGDSKGGGGQVTEGDGSATEGGDNPSAEPGEEANLEYNKQATELILQKLKKELERGEVDPELLEQLGWNQEEMKQFADRLSKYLDASKLAEESPEAKARQQQFEEMLKSLDLQKSGAVRSGDKEPKRDVSQVESKRTPVPAAYRSAYEKFTRDMARQKTPSNKKN